MKLNTIHAGRDMPRSRTRRGRGGFSLLEMLVAASLLVVIMLGLLAMFYQTEQAFRLGLAQSDILTGGRSAMELIARDIQSMRSAQFVGVDDFAVGPASGGVVQTLDAAGMEARENFFQSFYFLQKHNDAWKGIRYDFDPAETGVGAATLYRMEMPLPTLPTVVSNDPVQISQLLAKNDWSVAGRAYGRIVDGVVHLQVRPFDKFGNLIVSLPFSATGDPRDGYLFNSNTLPAFVEVEMGILEPNVLERFLAFPNDATRTNFLGNQAGKVHMFRQMIPIRSQPTLLANP